MRLAESGQTITHLCDWSIAPQTHSQVEEDAARYILTRMLETGLYPSDRYLLQHVRTALAILGADNQVIQQHSRHVASRVRSLRRQMVL